MTDVTELDEDFWARRIRTGTLSVGEPLPDVPAGYKRTYVIVDARKGKPDFIVVDKQIATRSHP